jgi:hypothetical protein
MRMPRIVVVMMMALVMVAIVVMVIAHRQCYNVTYDRMPGA